MSKQRGKDYSELLIWAAALVTVVRYAAAFVASDAVKIDDVLSEIITLAMGLSGVGMGILDVIGGTYLFTGWQRKMPKNGDAWSFKFKILTFFAVGLIVNGILILIPFTASRVSGNTMYHILGAGFFLYAWSAVVNIAPYLLIGGVAVGNNVVTVNTNEQANGSANGSPENQTPVNETRTYNKLTNTDKYYILNEKSEKISAEWGVTTRAIQKWRKRVQDEISQGKL